ncbi:YtcA family lipoprotein [Rahnella woolbedingensis]|nr:YtcA family lipoprotein [Rahnella woolbedingensis]
MPRYSRISSDFYFHWSSVSMRTRLHTLLMLPAILSLSGCSLSPSLPFLGAAFPDWLYCITGSAIITGLIFNLVGDKLHKRYKLNAAGWLLIAAILSMIIWLIIFS